MSNTVIRNENGELQELLDIFYQDLEEIQEELGKPHRREGDLA